MSDMETSSLLSPRKAAEVLGITAEEMLDMMLNRNIRTVADESGVMMVPAEAIEEYRRAHST